MAAPSDVLVLIHGMIPARAPEDHKAWYGALWRALLAQEPALQTRFGAPIEIEWGHPLSSGPTSALRDDQRLGPAQERVLQHVAYDNVRAARGDNEVVLSRARSLLVPPSQLLTRLLTDKVKEEVAIFGLSDVVYYCSEDGERAVRRAVYHQVLQHLLPYKARDAVRLHVFGHSLGVTVAFDFLFGLFATAGSWRDGEPDFLRDELVDGELRAEYRYWRQRAANGTLRFGSKTSTASQLPLLVMRKQKLVDGLAHGERLDASVIGLPSAGPVRWKLFYDVDDILGFPTRPLFRQEACMRELEVHTGWEPLRAHLGYWDNGTVVREMAQMLAETSAQP